ncbi:myosin heavy chain-related protein [Actinidia rufa]|uniref:Myosin heavy chain-related protein n=1 Tax=Actinidia rufa TaxID=165716 RepID=A0A7J0H105_9ERIC|nr:myosin heavy chain-related protein [Actinidia rufa]
MLHQSRFSLEPGLTILNGRDTIWPHDPRTGWSYCVTIPSWVVRLKSRDSDPVVVFKLNDSPVFIYAKGCIPLMLFGKIHFSFYWVQVGIQSAEGITTMRGVLRRFNNFLKLFTVLKKAFPKKNLPPAPPKGLLRIKSTALLEEIIRGEEDIEREAEEERLGRWWFLAIVAGRWRRWSCWLLAVVDAGFGNICWRGRWSHGSVSSGCLWRHMEAMVVAADGSRWWGGRWQSVERERRRCSLEEWMTKLLSDIDLSRSVAMASFLELEAAARSSFQDEKPNSSEANTSVNSTISLHQVHSNSSLSVLAAGTSLASDYGSDTAYESEIGTPSLGRDNSSEGGTDDLSLDEDLTSPIEKLVKYGMSNIDEGLFMGETILEQLEGLPKHKQRAREINSIIGKNMDNGHASKAAFVADNRSEHFSEPDHGKVIGHARKLSTESVRSDMSSLRGSELSNSGFPNSFVEGPIDHLGGPEASRSMEVLGNTEFLSSDVQLVLPMDQHQNTNRVLMTIQRRLVTAKTDMEDLISRLNQEIAVKDYLATKVKDLEVELETTKQKSKNNLQQAILIERERVTQMQWDMEELRRKSFEMELKLKSQQDEKSDSESTDVSGTGERVLPQELDATKKQLEDMLTRHQELEVKSKADIKVLVKEVKSLRSTKAELKKDLSHSEKEKSKAERLLQLERQCGENAKIAMQKLLHECGALRNQLQECNINFHTENGDKVVVDSSSLSHALDLLITSDKKLDILLAEGQTPLLVVAAVCELACIAVFEQFTYRPLSEAAFLSCFHTEGLWPAWSPTVKEDRGSNLKVIGNSQMHMEVQLLARGDDSTTVSIDKVHKIDDETNAVEDELRKTLKDIFTDNARLRKQVNSVLRCALRMDISSENDVLCCLWLNGKEKRLALTVPKRKSHPSWIITSVLDNRKSSINDNGATEPPQVLLERLFAQTQKLEEMGKDYRLFQDAHLGLNLGILESDLHAALAALKKKEEDLQDAERKVLLEHTELNRAKEKMVCREKEIAAACSDHIKLEEDLKLANFNLASQATQIEDLKLQIKQRVEEISVTQSALDFKENEMNKMKNELMEKSEEAVAAEFELKSKAHLLYEANEVVKKQKLELQQLQKVIQEKEEELEVSATLQKLEEEKLKVTEANLEKQTTEWLLAQEELKKLAEAASKRTGEAIETMEDFRRVKKLLADTRAELVSSQEGLASSRQKMEDQEQQLQKQLTELEEQRSSIMSYMKSLKEAHIDVESERAKLRITEAQNKELERDISIEKEFIHQLQEELDKERASLEQAIQEKSFLQEELDRESTRFREAQNLLQVKESELVEARLEIHHLKSEQASLQLILEERDSQLFNARKKLEEVNEEITELRNLLNSRENLLIQATSMLQEKEEHIQTMQYELNNTKLKYSKAETVVEQIVELTNKLVISVKDEDYERVNLNDDMGNKLSSPFLNMPNDEFKWQKKQLEAELEFTRESLRTKEMEVLAAQRALTFKGEELKMVIRRLESTDNELKKLKEEMVQDANDLRQLYALTQERIGERNVGDLAIEKLQLEATQLEVEAATSAIQKLADMSRELLFKASLSVEAASDIEVFLNKVSDSRECMVNDNECFSEVRTEVARLSALTDQIVEQANIVGDMS